MKLVRISQATKFEHVFLTLELDSQEREYTASAASYGQPGTLMAVQELLDMHFNTQDSVVEILSSEAQNTRRKPVEVVQGADEDRLKCGESQKLDHIKSVTTKDPAKMIVKIFGGRCRELDGLWERM